MTPSPAAKSKIFIVDDHPIVRQGLSMLVNQQSDMECVGEAEDAAQAMKGVDSLRPDLVLVDLSLKGKDGIELIKELKLKHPDLRALVVSMLNEDFYAERALRAGAKGYVTKQEAPDRLLSAMRHVLGGGIYVSENTATALLGKFAGGEEMAKSPVRTLSDRELTVFRMIGEGLSTGRIADSLHVSVKTVETHRMHIKEKLNLSDASELVRHAVQWVTLEKQRS